MTIALNAKVVVLQAEKYDPRTTVCVCYLYAFI